MSTQLEKVASSQKIQPQPDDYGEASACFECLIESPSSLLTQFPKASGWVTLHAADKIMERVDRDGANQETLRDEARKNASSKAERSQQIRQMESVLVWGKVTSCHKGENEAERTVFRCNVVRKVSEES